MNDTIINADDFGLSETVNEAITICFKRGYITRTTVMVNMPAFTECYTLASQNGFLDKVGLHLVLDEGVPLTAEIKKNLHFCKDGLFISGWYTQSSMKVLASRYDRRCLEEEIEAQMIKFREAGFILNHIDSHHFVHTASPVIATMVCRLANNHGFTSMRTNSIVKGDGLFKRILKKFIKNKIKSNFITTEHFASYKDYPLDVDDIEYMSHPDIVNGDIVDFLNRRTGEVKRIETKVMKNNMKL